MSLPVLGAAVPAIASEFGKRVLTAAGALDRAAMRQIVFSNPQARLRLEHILHPMIRQMAHDRTAAAQLAGAPYVLLVVPLLIEAPEYRQRIHRITVVDCDDELRIARVMSRSGLTRQEVTSIMAAQASRSNRLAIADDVIDNSGDMAALAARVGELHQHYQAISPDFLATG